MAFFVFVIHFQTLNNQFHSFASNFVNVKSSKSSSATKEQLHEWISSSIIQIRYLFYIRYIYYEFEWISLELDWTKTNLIIIFCTRPPGETNANEIMKNMNGKY